MRSLQLLCIKNTHFLGLLLTIFTSAHAMKMKKFDKNIFKKKNISSAFSTKILKSSSLKYIKTIHTLETHTTKHLFHTIMPTIHTNNDSKVSYIKKYDNEESHITKENMLIKIKKQPREFIKNFMKIKILKETSKKNVYLNTIGQKIFYNPENKKFYFDPRDIKIQTNGPVIGGVLYGLTKVVCYGGLLVGIGGGVVATGGGAVGVVAGASSISTAAAVTTAAAGFAGPAGAAATIVTAAAGTTGVIATTATAAVTASTGATVVALTTTAGASGGIIAGTATAIESAASFMCWVGTCIPGW